LIWIRYISNIDNKIFTKEKIDHRRQKEVWHANAPVHAIHTKRQNRKCKCGSN